MTERTDRQPGEPEGERGGRRDDHPLLRGARGDGDSTEREREQEEERAQSAPLRRRRHGLMLGGRDLDECRPDGRRRWDRVARFAERGEVKGHGFADEAFDFLPRVTCNADAGEVRTVRTPGIALSLDDGEVLAHPSCLRNHA